jgi:hypothetical protein
LNGFASKVGPCEGNFSAPSRPTLAQWICSVTHPRKVSVDPRFMIDLEPEARVLKGAGHGLIKHQSSNDTL